MSQKPVASPAGTHLISDSDSDATIEPDFSVSFDVLASEPSKQKSLSKRPLVRTLHSISDSDSDGEAIIPSKSRNLSLIQQNTGSNFKSTKCSRKSATVSDNNENSSRHDSVVSTAKKIKVKSQFEDSNNSSRKEYKEAQPYSFFLTKVSGISSHHNSAYVLHISDILSPSMGNLQASCQFNYMFDIYWLIHQYPSDFRKKPLMLVHGFQRPGLSALQKEASRYPNIQLCQAKLEIMFGTHHTKMMLLLYDNGLRIVIHTANLVPQDWNQKTQGVWVSPIFPRLSGCGGRTAGDSRTHFKKDLLSYIAAYKSEKLTEWEKCISEHDMSSARVFIVASVPGRHTDTSKNNWGHLKLRKVLQVEGPESGAVKSWPVIGQFSSIGSLGPTKENWLCGEWSQSLSTTKTIGGDSGQLAQLQLIFPSKDDVRLSLEGYPAGASIPYSIHVAKKQPYLNDFLHRWKAEGRGRSRASPHIKTYTRTSPDCEQAAWFLVTSANLSKAAWGALEKKGVQLMIRSYELGVLFLPGPFGLDVFRTSSDRDKILYSKTPLLPLPYDLPLVPYGKGDRPWIWDIAYDDLPDTHGMMWCPPK